MSTPSSDLGRTFCDLVMKGGITSGIAYPTAISGLAQHYRLRNIGGASAGAIAAAGAAAAEYRRQRYGSNEGFQRLGALAAELSSPPPSDPAGPSFLFQLFAPTSLSRPLFQVLAGALNRPTWWSRIALATGALLRAYLGTTLLGLAAFVASSVALVAVVAPGFSAVMARSDRPLAVAALLVLCAVPAFLSLAVTALLLVLGADAFRALGRLALVMAEQDFGLCTGMGEAPDGPPALTGWLHSLFQDIAHEPTGRPLTFGDLRRLRFAETPSVDGVVLRLMTTCLTLGRPFTLPIKERLYFDLAELRRYLPAEVVRWMQEQGWRPRNAEDRDKDALALSPATNGQGRPLLPIPEPDDFPILVGVRMSLSFPILLSAIPLYRYAVRREESSWVPYLERLIFSDGGICSNLPIHLFDAPLPTWPTFAINLRDDLPPGSPDEARVLLPQRGRTYQGDRYEISTDARLGAIASFLGAIAKTMQNWRDMLQRAAPGARERVFTIRHTSKEGGLNLNMDRAAIEAMARSGTRVAAAIQESFLKPPGTSPSQDDWEYHRWVRLRLLVSVLRTFLRGVSDGVSRPAGSPSVRSLLTMTPPIFGRSYELNQASRAAGWTMLDDLALTSDGIESANPDFERTSPRPPGELHVTPTF